MYKYLRVVGMWLLLIILIASVIANPTAAQENKSSVITPGNAAQLELLSRLGRGLMNGPISAGPTPNTLIIPTTLGFYVWDYTQPDTEPRLIPTEEPMISVLPSPDGQFIAARASDGTITIWNTVSGEITLSKGLPPPQAIGTGGMGWSANSQALAVGTWDDTVSIFDPHTGEGLGFFASGITIEIQGYVDPASLTSLSPDGTRIVWGNMGARMELRGLGEDIDLNISITRREDEVHATALSWSHDSQFVAIALTDGTLQVYDAQQGELIEELHGNLSGALGSAWQPGTGNLLYNDGGVLRLWDAVARDRVGTIFISQSKFAWSPDGTQFASLGKGGVYLVDATSGEPTSFLAEEDAVNATAEWSPNGQYLLMENEGMMMHWDVATGALIGMTGGGNATWVADGDLLAFYTPDSHTVWVVNSADGSPVATLSNFSTYAERLFWGSDGLQLAQSAFRTNMTTITNAQGKVLYHLVREDEMSQYGFIETYSVVWSPDGTRFATISPKGKIKIWMLNKEWPTVAAIIDAPDPNNLAFSADGKLIITTGWDNEARVYDGTTYEWITTLTGFDDPTNAAAFSPDGQYVAVGSYDRTVSVFNTTTWERVTTLPEYNYTYAKPNLAFSPDGTRLAYPNRKSGLTLWTMETGDLIETVSDSFGGGESLAWSPDSQLIATGMYSGEILVWDTQGQVLITLNEEINGWDYSQPVDALLFSPDGTQLIIAGDDSTVQIWGIAE